MQNHPFSKIIAGTMNWGVWGKNLNKTEMIDLINCCLENNISSFDHADIYGNFTTEKSFGNAFIESEIDRKKVQFISKCGIKNIGENEVKHYDYAAKHIVKSVENSLKNLQTDYLDVLLLHRPSPLMQADEIANTVQKLKKEGKILDFGVSNFTTSQSQLIESKIKINYNQIQFSATHFNAMLDGSLDYMKLNDIVPMAWNPMGNVFKNNDEKTILVKKHLEKIAQKYNSNIDNLLISWILKHPSGIIPVFGTADKRRVKNISNALEINLETEDWFAIWTATMGAKVP